MIVRVDRPDSLEIVSESIVSISTDIGFGRSDKMNELGRISVGGRVGVLSGK